MEHTSSLDGIVTAEHTQTDVRAVQRWKMVITGAVGVACAGYLMWCGILLLLLPSTATYASSLVTTGLFSLAAGSGIIIAVTLIALLHIARTSATGRGRTIALVKLGIIVVPGLIMSGITAFMILQEPMLPIDILYPTTTDELVAPVAITFGLQTSLQSLTQRGFTPIRYRWDINGDGKMDSETFDPSLTATYDRAGIFSVSVTMIAANGNTRIATRKLLIRQAVFSVIPTIPLVNTPVVFDVGNLLADGLSMTKAEWDFDSDGIVDETTTSPSISTIFYRTGPARVSVRVFFTNNTQIAYQRSIDIREPPPLPFPVSIESEPAHLVSTAPFTARFSVVTDERIAHVQWQFGDGGKGEGREIAHTFTRNGTYPVQAKVRTQSGIIADIATSVSIVERLDLPDLRFEGKPVPQGSRIEGEVPLILNLTPITDQPFVSFVWEAPNATEIGSTAGSLQAIYRREGTYAITLVGTNAEGKVLRRLITVIVRPPSSVLKFHMDPESGVAPLTVRLDASETTIPGDDITGFIWGFGDGSPKEYGGAYTEHVYKAAGTYVIDLSVRTAGGKQQSTTRTLVVRSPVLQACMLPSRIRGPAPFGVEFSSACTTGDIKNVLWNFGDGAQSDERNPVHIFMNPGTYDVRLTVTDSAGNTHQTIVSLTAE